MKTESCMLGWIHAVFTPVDSIAIGGNFLHGFNMAMQFKIDSMDRGVKLDQKFQFPSFSAVNWYAAVFYLRCLKAFLNEDVKESILSRHSGKYSWKLEPIRQLSATEFQGVKVLMKKLKEWSHAFERPVALDDWNQQSMAAAYMAAQRIGYERPCRMLEELHTCILKCSKDPGVETFVSVSALS